MTAKRDAAALARDRLITQAGLRWRQAVFPPPVAKSLLELETWHQTGSARLARRGSFWPCEIEFRRDLPRFRAFSTKQQYDIQTIGDRLIGADWA
jgi:hypothetical protein